MRGLLVVFALSGCDVVFHIDKIPGGGSGDFLDASGPKEDTQAPVCSLVGKYGASHTGFVSYCVRTDSDPTLSLVGSFDTTANPKCDYVATTGAETTTVCVVSAVVISVTGTLVVSGDKPLVLAALDTITITGSIDTTAGANPDSCTNKGMGAEGDANKSGVAGGGGGGGGGSWQTKGGIGGMGKVGTPALSGSTSALAGDIRGGCPGGNGGSGLGATGGQGGNGGGAIYLTARTAVRVSNTGVINASGRGGHGGSMSDGGAGGGGSGGLVAFDSPTVTFDISSQPGAKVFANGGGGGGGGSATGGSISSDPAIAAMGGTPNGGKGGIAQSAGVAATSGTVSGGGGGGGGQGFVILFSDQTAFFIDPNHFSPQLSAGS